MEEAADTSSAGLLVTCLFPDSYNWDDGALKRPRGACEHWCILVCVWWPREYAGGEGLVGGGISYSVLQLLVTGHKQWEG